HRAAGLPHVRAGPPAQRLDQPRPGLGDRAPGGRRRHHRGRLNHPRTPPGPALHDRAGPRPAATVRILRTGVCPLPIPPNHTPSEHPFMADLLNKILRAGEGKNRKRLERVVEEVAAWEETIAALSDDELKAKTAEFRQRLADGETLDDFLPEAFACVREAGKR